MKLTKEDLDKVRDIEGFPIAKDEDIIALSNPPYYTACPNPFIEQFIQENGTPYDEETDDYHKEPFAADVSEGKNDPIYNMQNYHTKVPYKAIMRYILHYTKKNDLIFDGFCGTGMTGVAAQMCGSDSLELQQMFEFETIRDNWGERKALLNDLSPAATFISYNYNNSVDNIDLFEKRWDEIFKKADNKYRWMYSTYHDLSNELKGITNYTVWSDIFICPECGNEFSYWDVTVDVEQKMQKKDCKCLKCGYEITKRECDHAYEMYYDDAIGDVVKISKQVPVLINYSYNGSRFDKVPDEYDLKLFEKIQNMKIDDWYPSSRMCEGGEARRNDKIGITHVHQFYSKRNLAILSYIFSEAGKLEQDEKLALYSAIRGSMSYGTKLVKVNIGRLLNGGGTFAFGAVTGTFYVPSICAERPILEAINNKVIASCKVFRKIKQNKNVLINTASLTNQKNIKDNCIDYIFTDPPFGDNLNYSELNFLWECWGKVVTQNESEAIINKEQHKGILEYQNLMTQCFKEYYRILKPNRWMTVEFHNSKNAVWNAIQEALNRAGFIVADVRTLDKQQGSFKQTTTTSAVKQDLVISVYKPKDSFCKRMRNLEGNQESAWTFVQQHLSNLPITVIKDDKIELIAERQPYLLFDRMVAYHIMNGFSVPLDATDFYKGLDEKFLKRDGMYFLSDQVNEYDTARILNDIEPIQFEMFVTNEKSAIAWLYQQLDNRQTYSELQPKFMKEIKAVDKYEEIPELFILLEENFLVDMDGRWYIPDVTKEADVVRLREKKLLKEFEGYMATKGKLKSFRAEAIRAGFAKLWIDKQYQLIVDIADRLPESVIQEDDKLLMYYDISLGRI